MVDQTANFRIVDIASSPFSRATMLTLTTKDDSGNPVSVGRWRKAPAQ